MLTTRFLLFLAPLGVYLGWLLFRLARGKRTNRFETSTGLSLLLMVYLVSVAGTGIFWVATQELPVFDWHYLPGYILLLVATVHVLFHWNSIALFFRRRAPQGFVTSNGTQFRTWVQWTGFCILGLGAASICFLMGTRFARQRISFSEGESGIRSASGGSSKEGSPMDPRRLRAEPVSVSLAQYYHQGCSYPNRFQLPGLTIQTRPAVYKSYPGQVITPLPTYREGQTISVLEAYQHWLSGQTSGSPTLDLPALALLLYHTQGIRESLTRNNIVYDRRTAPSAGGLYPVNLYVLARQVSGLKPGLYYYDPKQASLILIREDLSVEALANMAGSPDTIRSAPATLLYSVTFGRTAFKYQDRSYRYVAMDTGHAAYNMALCAASLGLRAPLIARFDDEGVNQLLGIRPAEEGTLLLQPLGGKPTVSSAEPRFVQAPLPKQQSSFLDLIHTGSALRKGKTFGSPILFPSLEKPSPNRIHLPAPAKGGSLYLAIRTRKSVRDYTGKPISQEELSALCTAAAGADGSAPDPFLSSSAPLNLYLLIRNVQGLQPGIYRYYAIDHSLALVRPGDVSQVCLKACLEQEFCGTANVVFAKTVTWDYLNYPDGDRGYRYANLRSGFMSEGLYLEGTALNIGVCGVGAFEDETMTKLIGLNPETEICVYVTAAGKL